MKTLLTAAFLLSLVVVGIAEAKDVIIPYDDVVKMVATKEYGDKLLAQCLAEKAIYVKLNDEYKTVKKLTAAQIQALIEENETRKQLGETQERIHEALQQKVLLELDQEKRYSRYKSETVWLAVLGLVLLAAN